MNTTRRGFLQTAGVAAAAVLAHPTLAAAADAKPLPPAVAALKSRTGDVQPITPAEREQRLERARELMVANQLDAIFLQGGTSLNYFSGMTWWVNERMFAMIVPAKGKPFFVCPAFEQDHALELAQSGLGWKNPEIRAWEDDDSPYELVAAALKARGIAGGTLGIEETVRWAFSDGVAKAAPALKLTTARPVVGACRMIKSEHELAILQVANDVTLAAYEAAHRSLTPGMTTQDLVRMVDQGFRQQGFEGDCDAQVGEYSALPDGSPQPQVIREGEIVLLDGGCAVAGYLSEMSRTFVLGKPTDIMKRRFELEQRAQAAALAAAKPGVLGSVVDAAARKLIVDAGYGPGYKNFTHRLGHSIGLDEHEWPYLSARSKLPLARGMVFTNEPSIYVRGEFGIRLDDCMHITADGARMFTPQSPSLENPFGKAS